MAQTHQAGISKSQIEEIKERVGIEDIVKKYVKLKHVGKNLFGLCPFHSEKSPSFSVNPELNIFKCYGCGEGGDVITFLQKIESLEFQEAVEMLAKEAGVTLTMTKGSRKDSQAYTNAKKIYEMASKYYEYILKKHTLGKSAREYIQRRDLSSEAVEEFGIGYAPPMRAKTSVSSFIKKNSSFTEDDLVRFGISTKKSGRCVDKFVDRVMFPIFDTTGNVIAFSGRVYRNGDERPKYINSPETILFQKRRNLYGLFQAKRAIRDEDLCILVEGQTDVISSWMHGVRNIAAPLGTGTTGDQLSRIKRYSSNLAIAFDKDSAGEAAHKRLAILAFKNGLNVYSIEIPYGNDADECIRHDPDLWEKAIDDRKPAASYFMDILSSRLNVQTLQGKQKLLDGIIPVLQAIQDDVTLDHHLKELSLLTDVPLDVLKDRVDKMPERPISEDEGDTEAYKGEDLSHERYLGALLLQFTDSLSWASEKIPYDDFESEKISTILKNLAEAYKEEHNHIEIESFVFSLPTEVQATATELIMFPLWAEEPPVDELTEEITDTIRKVKEHGIRNEISVLRKELSLSEKKGAIKKANEILNTIHGKLRELEALEED